MFFRRISEVQRVSIAAYLALALILVACQPPPAPVQEQLDQPPDSIAAEDLIGVWVDNYEVYSLFREDSTFRSAESLSDFETSPIDWGVYQLQGTQLTLTSSDESRFCRDLTGSYDIRLTAEGKLKMNLIEDSCTDRGIVLNSHPLSRVPEADVELAIALEVNRAGSRSITPTPSPVPPTTLPTPTLAAARSQTSEWLVYNTENSGLPQSVVIALAFDTQGDLWIGTLWGGMAKFDGEIWTVYNTDNSGLPSDQVSALAFDAQGTLWVGTGDGLAEFDGETWTVYNTDNSDLPYDAIHELIFDTQGNLWIGTGKFMQLGGGGLAKFDGETWDIHTMDNSALPGNQILALAVDSQGNLWTGTERENGVAKFDGETWTAYTADTTELQWGPVPALNFDAQGTLWVANINYGVATFDGVNWTEYTPRNSELPSVAVKFHSGNVFDGQGDLWISTHHRGVVKYDGQSWTVYNEDNSGLPDNNIWVIAVDVHGNKWIGTDGGLAAYREGGVILSDVGE